MQPIAPQPSSVRVQYSHYKQDFALEVAGTLRWAALDEKYCISFVFRGAFAVALSPLDPQLARAQLAAPAVSAGAATAGEAEGAAGAAGAPSASPAVAAPAETAGAASCARASCGSSGLSATAKAPRKTNEMQYFSSRAAQRSVPATSSAKSCL
eukprot:Transcript_16713.p1 GENE.Transcript_16713~~Transcript_16713.p1  ORF type:complete len:154 (+),score=46.25 Transcript_16713:1-462(+)